MSSSVPSSDDENDIEFKFNKPSIQETSQSSSFLINSNNNRNNDQQQQHQQNTELNMNNNIKTLKQFVDDIQNKFDLYVEEYLTIENLTEFNQYICNISNTPQFVEQINLRVAQSIINRWDQKSTNSNQQQRNNNKNNNIDNLLILVHKLYDNLSIFSSNQSDEDDNNTNYYNDYDSDGEEFINKLIHLINPLKNTTGNSNSIHHRNICLIMTVMLERGLVFNEENSYTCLSYLVKLIEECTRSETLLYACFTIESLIQQQHISNVSFNILFNYKFSNF